MSDMHRLLQLHSTDQPEVHGIAPTCVLSPTAIAPGTGERVLIGEILPAGHRLCTITAVNGRRCTCPSTSTSIDAPWEARSLATLIADYEAALPPGWLAELGARQP